MQFYANLMTTAAPNRIDLYVDYTNPNAPRLIEKVTPPTPDSNPPNWTSAEGRPVTRYVGQYVVNGTSAAIRRRCSSTTTRAERCSFPWSGRPSLDPTQFASIYSVLVTLSVRKSTERSIPATTLVNQVTLPEHLLQRRRQPHALTAGRNERERERTMIGKLRRDEQGIALITVLILTMVALALVVGPDRLRAGVDADLPPRPGLERGAGAAQAGLNDYVYRLNQNGNYWQYSTTNLPPGREPGVHAVRRRCRDSRTRRTFRYLADTSTWPRTGRSS